MYTIIVILICLLLSAFFSGMEIAYISSNRMQVELDIKKGKFNSWVLQRFLDYPRYFIICMLVGNNIALVIFGILMEKILSQPILSFLGTDSTISVLLLQTFISTIIVLFFAEFIPKAVFRNFPNDGLRYFAIPTYGFQVLLYPINVIILGISNLIISLLGKGNDEQKQTGVKDELRYLLSEHLSESEEERVETEIQIFHNALAFSEIKARECMVPRKEIIALEVNTSIESLKDKFIETGLSKIIIFRGEKDKVIGYVHSFEVFKRPNNIQAILLPVEFVYESNTAKEVLNKLLTNKRGVAIILDEHGGTAGMLTIEDIVEELFGEIEDEHDTEDLVEIEVTKGEYLFSARLEIDYLNEKYNLDFPLSDSYETLGGFIIDSLGKIPMVGDEVKVNQFIISTQRVSETKIETVKIKKSSE